VQAPRRCTAQMTRDLAAKRMLSRIKTLSMNGWICVMAHYAIIRIAPGKQERHGLWFRKVAILVCAVEMCYGMRNCRISLCIIAG